MFRPDAIRLNSFWWFQTAGWACFSLLSLLIVLPYLRRPAELGYQDLSGLLVDQTLMCLCVFLASVALRPVCRSLLQRSLPWISLEVHAAGWSFAIGISATSVTSRFILAKPEPLELLEACVKMSVLLFLWCNLYFSIKQSKERALGHEEKEQAVALPNDNATNSVSRFLVRTGQRIQVVPTEDIAWIASAGDYVELHTQNATHLLRETMQSLGQKLDQTKFARIHRSRIVNLSRILELRGIENREYIVKLSDGSLHRSSRTYAPQLERWLHSGKV